MNKYINIYILIVLSVTFVITLFRSFSLLRRNKESKKYIELYEKVFTEEDNAYEEVTAYCKEETNTEFKNKALFFKSYGELDGKGDYNATIDSIDLTDVFYNKKGEVDKDKMTLNSEVFILAVMNMAKARSLSMFDVVEKIVRKFDEHAEKIGYYAEYNLIKSFDKAVNEKEDGGVEFLKTLSEGDYSEYKYDKHFIRMYKRIAAATLDYLGETFDEYYAEDLKDFAKTIIGSNFLKDLGIFDKYYVPVTEEEEKKEEE